MDEFITAATSSDLNEQFYEELNAKYTVKRLGQPITYLNWTIVTTNQGTLISQPIITQRFINEANMNDCHPHTTPYTNGIYIDTISDQDTPADESKDQFHRPLGTISYLADCTRSHIAFVTAKLARATSNPTIRKWCLLKTVTKYLQATPNHGI